MLKTITLASALFLAPATSNAGAYFVKNQVKKESSELDMSYEYKNFANDFVDILEYHFDYNNFAYRFLLYAYPNTNETFKINEQTSYYNYRMFNCSIPFLIGCSLVRQEVIDGVYTTTAYASGYTTFDNTNEDFKGYVLPRVISDNSASIQAFKVNSSIAMTYYGTNAIGFKLNSTSYKNDYQVEMVDNLYRYYMYHSSTFDINNYLGDANLLLDLSSFTSDESLKIAQELAKNFNIPSSAQYSPYYDFEYNCSISNTHDAWSDGYEIGRELKDTPVGLEWVKGAIKTCESFLNISLGFFTLGQLLGGVIVILVVLWILRWFI